MEEYASCHFTPRLGLSGNWVDLERPPSTAIHQPHLDTGKPPEESCGPRLQRGGIGGRRRAAVVTVTATADSSLKTSGTNALCSTTLCICSVYCSLVSSRSCNSLQCACGIRVTDTDCQAKIIGEYWKRGTSAPVPYLDSGRYPRCIGQDDHSKEEEPARI